MISIYAILRILYVKETGLKAMIDI